MKFTKEKQLSSPSPIKSHSSFSIKFIRSFFILFSLLIIISGPLSSFKTYQLKKNLDKEKIEFSNSLNKKLSENNSTIISSDLFKQFLNKFIDTYINVPVDQTQFEKRISKLKEDYFSFSLEDFKNSGTERKLISSTFYDLSSSEDVSIARYLISYEIISPISKEPKTTKIQNSKEKMVNEKHIDHISTKKNTLLNIPFNQNEDHTFQITAYPYFTNEPLLTNSNKSKIELDTTNFQEINPKDEEKVINFATSFLEKYVSSTLEDMSYLMKKPEILSGEFQINNPRIEVYSKDKKLLCFINFEILDKNTSMAHDESMTLFLKKRDNTYYIEKLNHYLGGI